MACFPQSGLTLVSASEFTVNGTTGHRLQLVNNATGGTVIAYYFPPLQSSVAPDGNLSYIISFSANSTYTGVYIEGAISGNESVYGFAGISGSSHYAFFKVGISNKATVTFLVSESSSSPYVVGIGSTYGSYQNLALSNVEFASCGETWISQVSAV